MVNFKLQGKFQFKYLKPNTIVYPIVKHPYPNHMEDAHVELRQLQYLSVPISEHVDHNVIFAHICPDHAHYIAETYTGGQAQVAAVPIEDMQDVSKILSLPLLVLLNSFVNVRRQEQILGGNGNQFIEGDTIHETYFYRNSEAMYKDAAALHI